MATVGGQGPTVGRNRSGEAQWLAHVETTGSDADMTVIITPADRHHFKRCRRAWDLGSPHRRNLEPADAGGLDADRLIRDALAVYYFPGMWDWPRAIVLPLVSQALDKGLSGAGNADATGTAPAAGEAATAMRRLLGGYTRWAPVVEHLAPVLVEVEYGVDLADPEHPDSPLRNRSGEAVRFQGRVDVLAIDEYDAYWILRHQVVESWTPLEALLRDEESLAAAWAWEQFYLGVTISGTIHNEMRVPAEFEPDVAPATRSSVGHERGLPQSEGSGGGRSVPQHRRLDARASEPEGAERVVQELGPWFRRTWIRRSRSELEQAGRDLADDVVRILNVEDVYPSPSSSNCNACWFQAPCGALYRGEGADRILSNHYRARPPDVHREGRLGSRGWSVGRGAAPPRFGDDR